MADSKIPAAMGGTFAERRAAARGDKTFTAPAAEKVEQVENSTFASRAGRTRKASAKQVDSESKAENKAVGDSESKKPARKRS